MKACLSLLVALAVWFTPLAARAVDLTLIESRVVDRVPLIQPDWPRPDEPGQVFYVQRSMNPNTVVYAAAVTPDGEWADPPILVYWRRYNTDGAVRALSFAETRFGYGVRVGRGDGVQWPVTIRALPDMALVLTEDARGPGLFVPRETGALRLIYAYLTIDETGLVPRVTGMIIVGRNTQTDAVEQLTFAVTGAAIEVTQ